MSQGIRGLVSLNPDNLYYLWSREEVETYLEERRRVEEAVRRENETRFPSAGVRERLLARRPPQV